jgi:hypothetical protein
MDCNDGAGSSLLDLTDRPVLNQTGHAYYLKIYTTRGWWWINSIGSQLLPDRPGLVRSARKTDV